MTRIGSPFQLWCQRSPYRFNKATQQFHKATQPFNQATQQAILSRAAVVVPNRSCFSWVHWVTILWLSATMVPGGHSAELEPVVTSWLINGSGATGSSTNTAIHAVVSGYDADVQQVRHNDSDVYVNATGVPSYPVGPWPDGNPGIATDREWLFRIPKSPEKETGTKTDTPLGNIGVLVNGVPMFNVKDAFSYRNQGVWNQNAVINEADGMDAALGHPAPAWGESTVGGFAPGRYHHHQQPVSLRAQLGDDGSGHSPILGFAFDGFPIYGPYGFANAAGTGGAVRMESSYQLRSGTRPLPPSDPGGTYDGTYMEDYEFVSGSGHLDEHNGHFMVTPEYPDGIYHYHTTVDNKNESAFPYLLGTQFYGVVVTDNLGNGLSELDVPADVVEYTLRPYSWVGVGNWSDSSNWAPAGVPDADWVVTLDNDFDANGVLVLVDRDSAVDNISLLGSTGPLILEVATDVTLTVPNGIEIGSAATLKGKGTVFGDVFNNAGSVGAGMPEPSTGLLLVVGLLGLLGCARGP